MIDYIGLLLVESMKERGLAGCDSLGCGEERGEAAVKNRRETKNCLKEVEAV